MRDPHSPADLDWPCDADPSDIDSCPHGRDPGRCGTCEDMDAEARYGSGQCLQCGKINHWTHPYRAALLGACDC